MMNRPPLRIGILLANAQPAAWINQLVHDLYGCNHIQLIFFACTDDPAPQSAVYRVFQAWERWLSKFTGPYEDALVLNSNVSYPDQYLETNQDGLITEKALANLQGMMLDLLLVLGGQPFDTRLIYTAKLGLLACQPDPTLSDVVFSASIREITSDAAFNRQYLILYTRECPQGHVLYATSGSTQPLLFHARYSAACWKLRSAILRELERLHHPEYPISLSEKQIQHSNIDQESPSFQIIDYIRYQFRQIARRICTEDHWTLAIRPYQNVASMPSGNNFSRLSSPAGRFLADPFLVEDGNRQFVFVEDYSYATKKAVISCFELDALGKPSEIKTVLEHVSHLSYPFVFQSDGRWYMIPETAGNRTIELYEAVHFPYEWRLSRILMDKVIAVDTTLLQQDGRWWMFTNIASPPLSETDMAICDELFLFYADKLQGPWFPHRMNPVISDARYARSAGRIFHAQGDWIRPVQDCSVDYGTAVTFCRIDELTPNSYQQTALSELNVYDSRQEGYCGLHTYNASSTLEIIDLKSRPWRFKKRKG